MELRHLRYFVAVAEELHFGRAAVRLHMTQPPLSKQIQALERQLGVELFVRGRTISLTEPGRAFLTAARRTLATAEAAASAARAAAAGTQRALRIGFPATAAHGLHVQILRCFEQREPSAQVELIVGHTAAHLDALRTEDLDAAFVQTSDSLAWDAPSGMTLRDERLLLAVPIGHPLSDARLVTRSQLRDQRVILFPRAQNPTLHDHLIEHVLGPREARSAENLEATTLETGLSSVSMGLGVSLVTESIADNTAVRGVDYLPFGLPSPVIRHAVAWRDDPRHALLELFVGAARSVVDQQEPPLCQVAG